MPLLLIGMIGLAGTYGEFRTEERLYSFVLYDKINSIKGYSYFRLAVVAGNRKSGNDNYRLEEYIMKITHNCVQRKLLALLLVCALMLAILPLQDVSAQQNISRIAGYGLSNPVVDSSGVTTWDCIYFGHYWKNVADGDGKEKIKWRVLSVEGDDVFLLSDRNLSRQVYNSLSDHTGVKWETSTIRSWLNGYDAEENVCGQDYSNDNFLDAAFDAVEQAAIADTLVVNTDNSSAFPDNGNDTVDKVYLLSVPEVMKESYGFESTWNNSKKREAKNIAYIDSNESNGSWWLRTVGMATPDRACYIDGAGRLWRVDEDASLSNLSHTVRPALHLNLSALDSTSNLVWSYAGKITSNGQEIEAELPKPEATIEATKPAIATEMPSPATTTEAPKPVTTTEPLSTATTAPNPVATTEVPKPVTTTEVPKPVTTTEVTQQPPLDATPQSVQSPKPVKVSGITVSGKITKLAKGKKAKLKLTVEPIDAANKSVVWSSSNPKVADVDSNGTVTAKASGKTVIIATAVDGSGVSGFYTIAVVKHIVKKIILKPAEKNVVAGKKVKVKATIKTSGKTANKVLEWKTSNQKYATVTSRGVVTTKKAGKGKTVTITAKAMDGSGKKGSVKIKIQ